ncbi:hypothetical protein E3J38_09485 [candidate division TA06 bacterium]|uniref:Uncharacterized protein n=1 Tax=candidate division TA06 bacterium TaxID=2250710 RepID=A0A523XER2_UNCT6|nr:MAG: hypothetical protein E3J38_09485 [candidate division TA06 bacterium]
MQENLMPILGASELRSLQAFTEFTRLMKRRAGDKLRTLKGFTIREGFHASPAGLSQLTFVTRPTGARRVSRAFLLLGSENAKSINANVKGTDLWVRVEKAKVLPALRTLTNVSSFHVQSNCDYFIKEYFENYRSVLLLSKWQEKRKFSWRLVAEKASGKPTYLALARRFRPNSKNTHLFAFYSNSRFMVPDTFKIIQTTKQESKLQCLYLNSVLGLLNVVLFREQTTGGYTDIRESDLRLFDTIDSRKLSNTAVGALNDLFVKLRSV